MARRIVVITLVFIFIVLILRKPDKIIKITQMLNEQFRKIWLSLVTV